MLAEESAPTQGGIAEAVRAANVVTLAISCQKMEEAIQAAGDLRGKILVDISNSVMGDYGRPMRPSGHATGGNAQTPPDSQYSANRTSSNGTKRSAQQACCELGASQIGQSGRLQ